jgi:superfamily II DNA or RNA helicase
VKLTLDLNSPTDYRTFLRVKSLPVYRFTGREAWFPDEYAEAVGLAADAPVASRYSPRPWLFDYQRDISALAVRKEKYAAFIDCGLGKTLIELEFARHVSEAARYTHDGRRKAPGAVLIVCPLMVVGQTIAEAKRFYGDDLPIEPVAARDLPRWLAEGSGRIGITNYEAVTVRVTDPGRLAGLILDESSMLKSHYGQWGRRLIRLGRGLRWKLCLTGTPAPNDRVEFANHAVFLDQFPTVNSFLSKFFVNRGETGERWELKPHALRPFYRALSHWSIFLTSPAVYGWKDNAEPPPRINTHVLDVPLTSAQMEAAQAASGNLFGSVGGIGSRHKMARIAKGIGKDGKSLRSKKPRFVADLTAGDDPCIVWCRYNPEQAALAKLLPDAANVSGDTPVKERERLIRGFQRGECRVLLTKPKLLGFGLNLQAANRQVFSTCQDSYEEFYQAVKRSNRYGSTKPLDVYIPVTDLERPMVETVLTKAARVQADAEEQERLFKEVGYVAV